MYAALEDEECRRLANQHNLRTAQRPISFEDKTRQARGLLLRMSGLDEENPDWPSAEPFADVPKGFREKLQRQLCMEDKVHLTY